MTPVEEVLQTWREAERVLEALPPINPDHESIALAIARLKNSYQALADRRGHSAEVIASATRTLEEAHAMLARVTSTGTRPEPYPDEPPGG